MSSIPTFVMVVCTGCLQEIRVKPHEVVPGYRCNSDCLTREERAAKRRQEWLAESGADTPCDGCGQVFKCHPSAVRKKNFCTSTCKAESLKRLQERLDSAAKARADAHEKSFWITCKNCGQEKRATSPAKARKTEFCSHTCAHEHLYPRKRSCKLASCTRQISTREHRLYCSEECLEKARELLKADWSRVKEQAPLRRKSKKMRAIEYKGGHCQVCGYDRCAWALQFHHVDESTKSFEISKKIGTLSFENLVPELDKCALVCANCHAEIHAGLIHLGEGPTKI